MLNQGELEGRGQAEAHAEEEVHEPPRGALLITVAYLLIITALWIDVYLNLLGRGIPTQ